jgi:hypothetical protein
MRTTEIGVIVLCVAAVGCIDRTLQPALQPLVPAGQALALPDVVGIWADGDGDGQTLEFRPGDDPDYELLVREGGEHPSSDGPLRVRFAELGGDVYWDLAAVPGADEGDLWRELRQPVHAFARVSLAGDRLEIALLDPEKVAQAIQDGRVELAHAAAQGGLILTASSDELQSALPGELSDCFEPPAVYQRVAEPSEP